MTERKATTKGQGNEDEPSVKPDPILNHEADSEDRKALGDEGQEGSKQSPTLDHEADAEDLKAFEDA